MKNEKFIGTGVAVVTPFHSDGSLDDKSLERIVNHLIFGGVEYLVMLGTTGETATLTKKEKRQVVDTALEMNEGRIGMVMGIGGSDTALILETIKETNFDGIDAILSVSPYYNKPSQQGIYYHYQAIADASPVPVIMYNVPARTASNMTADTTLKLAELPNIIGIKEASNNIEQCMQIIKDKPEDFLVISGDDLYTLPLMAAGMDGVISVTANAFPSEFSTMVRECLNGNYEEGKKIHYDLMEAMQLAFAEGSPAGIKSLLEIKGLCNRRVRLPLYHISDALHSKMEHYK